MPTQQKTKIQNRLPSVTSFALDNNIPYFKLQVDYKYDEQKEKWEKTSGCPSLKNNLPNDYHRNSLMTNEKIRDSFNEQNENTNAIALMMRDTPFVLVDTDSKQANNTIQKIMKERGWRNGSTQTKKGFHYYFKIIGDKSKISFGANPSTNIDILGNKNSLAFELNERNFSKPEPFTEVSVDDFIAYIQTIAKKPKKETKKKETIDNIKAESKTANYTIKEKSYASGLINLFDPNTFADYHNWRMLANWCVVHNDFKSFHQISEQAPNYKNIRDCKKCYDNEISRGWRISIGWGVNMAKQSNLEKWLEYKKKHFIRSPKGFTDYEIARKLQENFCDKFISIGKELFYFDGTKWIDEGEGFFRRVLSEDLYYNIQSFIDHEDEQTQDNLPFIYVELNKLRSTSKQNSVLTQFMSMVQEKPDIFVQENDHLFPFMNGVYDIKQKKLIPHNSNYFNRVCFEFDYEPDIMKDEQITNEIIDMWEKIFHEPEDLEFVKTAISKHLAGIQTKHILWLYGSKGNNGKSALLGILTNALSSYATSINTSLLQSKFDSGKPQPELNKLMGKKLILGSEVDTTQPFNTQTIKSFTGGDPITGRLLYSNTEFKFICKSLFVIACNQFPDFTDNDKALHESRNRTIPIDTEFLPKEKYDIAQIRYENEPEKLKNVHLGDEKFISDTYQKESKTYMIHILMDWLTKGYHLKELKQPKNSKKHMQEALCDTDEIALLLDYTEEANWNHIITARELYQFALQCGAKPLMSENKFCKAIAKNTYLDDKYIAKLGKKRGVIRGYKLKSPDETSETNDLDE